MTVEVSTPDIPGKPAFRKSKDAGANAPAPISFTAAAIARDLFKEHLEGLRAPAKHRVIPEITVTMSYRLEPVEE